MIAAIVQNTKSPMQRGSRATTEANHGVSGKKNGELWRFWESGGGLEIARGVVLEHKVLEY
jgi:hypothetical protein